MADLVGNAEQVAILTSLASTWTSPKLHLFTNNVVVSPTDTLSTYTEVLSGVSWYPSGGASITYGLPFIDDNGTVSMIAPETQFSYSSGSGSDSPVTVHGWYVTSPSTTLRSSGNLNVPKVMASSTDAIPQGSEITLPPMPQGSWVG